MAIEYVDSTQLDSDLTSVANAIRAKSGGSSQLAFPAGFVSEIQAIPSGTPERTKWYRPPDWPDLSSLTLTPSGSNTNKVYYTIDTSLLPDKTIYSNNYGFSVGHIDSGVFVSDYTATQESGTTYKIVLPNDCPRYVVAYYAQSGYSGSRGLIHKSMYDLPVVEIRFARGVKNLPLSAYPTAEIFSIVNPDYSLNFQDTHWGSGATKVIIFENGLTIYSKISALFQNRRALQEIHFNQETAVTKTSIGTADNFCAGCVCLKELDMSWLHASGFTNFGNMFDYCFSLKTLNLSNWDMSTVTGTTNTFRQCYSLENFILDDAILPKLNISLSDSSRLTDESLVNIANALFTGAAKTLTLNATPKGRLSTIMGTVDNDIFTADENGDTTLMSFITNTKGWTVA